MNLMSCKGFSRKQQSTVILTCWISLVSYYISNGFVVVKKKEGDLDKVTGNIKNKISEVENMIMIMYIHTKYKFLMF